MNKIINALCVATLLSVSALASAAPADDANAHFKAIAAGNVDQVMLSYGDNATLQWVGGPLDGAHVGNDKIRETWGKFAKASWSTKYGKLIRS